MRSQETTRAARRGSRLRHLVLGSRALKPVVFTLSAVPLASLVWRAATLDLGADPQRALLLATGLWALRLLLLTLAVTPLRQLGGWVELARLRRMLGLWAFAYACVHFSVYFVLLQHLDLAAVAHDTVRHPFVLAGMSTLGLLLPLALTSTNAMVRRLGAMRWRALHRLVYPAAALGVFHFWWGKLAKNDLASPERYVVVLALLLGWRVWYAWRARRARRDARA